MFCYNILMNGKQILATLLGDISSGVFAQDGKLPSEAALCKRFGVSRMTLRGALAELQRRGLITKRNGAGSFLTRLAERKSGIIGMVVPDFRQFEFFSTLREELSRHCARLRYRVELVTTGETDCQDTVADLRHKVRRLAALRPEGVIFRPYVSNAYSKANREVVQILRHAEIPVVLIDADIVRPPERSDCDLVAVDNIAAGRRIAHHLYQKGYRRIAFLAESTGRRMNANWSNRLFGLAGELALLGAEDYVQTLSCRPDDVAALAMLLRKKNRPEAIVCGNDERAAILLASFKSMGVRIPEDIAVIGFDNSEHARLGIPPLTTISQPVGKIAATAFKTLLSRIRYPNNDPRETYLAAPLIVRSST